jgi:hypothetical protein
VNYYFVGFVTLVSFIFCGTIIELETLHLKERKNLYNRLQAKDTKELIQLERAVTKEEDKKVEKKEKPKFI